MLLGTSPSNRAKGEILIKSTAVRIAFGQNDLRSLASISIHVIIYLIILFILSINHSTEGFLVQSS